jgi:hypothetical protein
VNVGQSVTEMPRPEGKTETEMTRPNLGCSVMGLTRLTRLEAEPGEVGSKGPRLASERWLKVTRKSISCRERGDLEKPVSTESVARVEPEWCRNRQEKQQVPL